MRPLFRTLATATLAVALPGLALAQDDAELKLADSGHIPDNPKNKSAVITLQCQCPILNSAYYTSEEMQAHSPVSSTPMMESSPNLLSERIPLPPEGDGFTRMKSQLLVVCRSSTRFRTTRTTPGQSVSTKVQFTSHKNRFRRKRSNSRSEQDVQGSSPERRLACASVGTAAKPEKPCL